MKNSAICFIMCAERRHTMDQYQIIENLIDLYSPDDEVRLEALLAKKEWILDRFYVPYSILPTSEDGYSDLYALKNQALAFHKINLPNITNKSTANMIERFNSRFKLLKLYENLPERPHKHIFYAKVNFRRLDKDEYKVLVPYFFYCLDPEIVKDSNIPNDIRKVIAYAISGEETEAVQIIDNKNLDKNIFKIDCFEKIYVYDDLTQNEIASIKDLAKYLQLPVVMVHVGRKKVK